MEHTEVRHGEWITHAVTISTILSAGPPDDRTPDQMRRDALIERIARTIARAEAARSRAVTADLTNPYPREAQVAAEAEVTATLATIEAILGDDERIAIHDAALRIWSPEHQ